MVKEKNIRLIIEYDGTNYAGWQVQPRQKTVQGEIESALQKLTGQKPILFAAGRTDAGVHALAQVANFRIAHRLPVKKYRDGLNFYLPDDILIGEAGEVAPEFHSRYDAAFRSYRYLIARRRSALYHLQRWECSYDLNRKEMDRAAEYVRGEHDFSAFCVTSSQKEDNRCLVYESKWREENGLLVFEITANRFLHSMIRSLVGLMVDLGRGAIDMKAFKKIIAAGDHSALKHVAPARGLYLAAIGYEEE